MSSCIKADERIIVSKSFLSSHLQWAALDFGQDLLKVVYILKSAGKPCPENDATEFASKCFKKSEFHLALSTLQNEAQLWHEKGRKLAVIGRVDEDQIRTIRDVLEVEVVLLGHNCAMYSALAARGLHSILESVSHLPQEALQTLCHAKLKLPEYMLPQETFQIVKMVEEMNARAMRDSQRYPCLCVTLGSVGISTLLQKDGSSSPVSFMPLVGHFYSGLFQALLDTANYEDACKLSSRGFRGNVDLQVKDVMTTQEATVYGKFHPEMPGMHFSKMAEREELRLETVRREDVAHTLVSSAANILWRNVYTTALLHRAKEIYFLGAFCQSAEFRLELELAHAAKGKNVVNVHVLRCLGIPALGAFSTDSPDC